MLYDLSLCSSPSSLLIRKPAASFSSPSEALLHGFCQSPSGDWVCLHHHTQALISASRYVGLPLLSSSLLPEWRYRISSLHDAGLYFHFFVHESQHIPHLITDADLHRHLGARFHVTYLSNPTFDHSVRLLRVRRLLLTPSPPPLPPTPNSSITHPPLT